MLILQTWRSCLPLVSATQMVCLILFSPPLSWLAILAMNGHFSITFFLQRGSWFTTQKLKACKVLWSLISLSGYHGHCGSKGQYKYFFWLSFMHILCSSILIAYWHVLFVVMPELWKYQLVSWYTRLVFTELEQEEALQYLRGWLQHHPKYGMLVPHDAVDRLNHTEVRILSSCLTITSILDKMKLWS